MTSGGSLSLASTARISDDAILRAIGDEGVVLDLASGTYFGLNAVGLRMWELIEQLGRLEVVRDAVVTEYDVDRDTAGRDLANLVGQLALRGLVEVSE